METIGIGGSYDGKTGGMVSDSGPVFGGWKLTVSDDLGTHIFQLFWDFQSQETPIGQSPSPLKAEFFGALNSTF